MDLDVDSKGNLIATDIQDVSAIALGNSEIETPGFAGATLLGQLQAFAKEHEKENVKLSLRRIRQIDHPE
jgi:hypothetical protein